MLQTNDITYLLKEFFGTLFHKMRSRMFLDSMTIWHVIPKVSGCHRRIYRMFLAIILLWVIIPKVSAFCSVGVDKTENVGIINGYAEPIRPLRLSDFIRDWASKNGWLRC